MNTIILRVWLPCPDGSQDQRSLVIEFDSTTQGEALIERYLIDDRDANMIQVREFNPTLDQRIDDAIDHWKSNRVPGELWIEETDDKCATRKESV